MRERALDITHSFIVEAPAGSGKTGLLVERFLKLLATVDDPAQVLAITFTRKATAELRDRILTQLTAAHASTPTENPFDRTTRALAEAVLVHDAAFGWNLLDNPHRLYIRTIDAVSRDIASALPVLSGSGGALAPTENATPFHAEAARRTLLQLGGSNQALSAALEELLLHRDGNLQNCENLIATMLATRDQWAELIPLAPDQLTEAYLEQSVLPKLDRALDLVICRGLTAVSHALPPGFLDDLCTLAADMAQAEGYPAGDSSPLAFCAGTRIPPAEKSAHLHHWLALVDLLLTKGGDFRNPKGLTRWHLRFEIRKDHKQELARVTDAVRDNEALCELLCSIRTLPPAHYPPDQWRVAKSLFRVLAHALAELQVVFAAQNTCDFAEVALLARGALAQDSALDDLAAASGANLQHLLVDEMQDTSSTQYELIHLLTQHWDGHSQTVFLVGDPKQSIYLFRQARVERFVHTMLAATLGSGPDALPLTPLHLSANFRSQAPLVQAFNQDFAHIFPSRPDAANPEQVPYRPAHPTRAASPLLETRVPHPVGGPASSDAIPARIWHANPIPNSPDSPTLRTLQTQAHAQEIRTLIERWRALPLPPNRIDPIKPWSIAVLVQARTHLPPIIQALKQAVPIPYRAVNVEPLAERLEILDLLALTRALLHPADRTAWLSLLRAPCCGLTLADLHRLAGQDDRTLASSTLLELIETRGELLSEDGIARLQPFWTIMSAALAQRGRLPLSQWVARTAAAFAIPAFASPEARANTETYLALLDTLETSTGVLDLALLAQRLKKLYAAPSLTPGAVDLMTIHNAKGLEWDFVIVPALDRTGRTSQGRLLDWLEIQAETGPSPDSAHDIAPGILAPIHAKGGSAGKLNDYIRGVESTRAAAERKRLFYVACTRAREELHLFAAPDTKVNGELSIPPASLLAAAWPAAAPHFTAIPGPVLQMPIRPTPTFAIAASAPPARIIQRIPTAAFQPGASAFGPSIFASTVGVQTPPHTTFDRPQGSFAARTLGNTLHAFLQLLATRLAGNTPAATLRNELPTWSARISAVLRATGLAPADIPPLTQTVLRALTETLEDQQGQWLLAPHPQAASESAFSFRSEDETRSATIRLDRTFRAGPTPLSLGSTHLWIVDYKTATHAESGLEAFLEGERRTYAPQLEAYARHLAASPDTTRLALYYPLLSHLLWWSPVMPN